MDLSLVNSLTHVYEEGDEKLIRSTAHGLPSGSATRSSFPASHLSDCLFPLYRQTRHKGSLATLVPTLLRFLSLTYFLFCVPGQWSMAHVIVYCQGPGLGPRSPFFSFSSGITDFSSPLAQPGLLVWQRPNNCSSACLAFPSRGIRLSFGYSCQPSVSVCTRLTVQP